VRRRRRGGVGIAPPEARARRVTQTLAAIGADSGRRRSQNQRARGSDGLDGTLVVVVGNLDPSTTYEIVLEGVRIGS